MGRPKQFSDSIMLRISKEALDAIEAALLPDEDRAGFIRSAIGRELAARSSSEKAPVADPKPKKQPKDTFAPPSSEPRRMLSPGTANPKKGK